ncbi:hypothetical protein RvY_00808 [Ramazzottius varieornatus]|uniref:Uncharacterized protein n=1 Tax=Ramazzottius varieornatus TaxID=947166 RepID=A0A1D1UL87_RAMVA|nr:hypothetical protein RvY_00808 [Ramazzottius varieornatus]
MAPTMPFRPRCPNPGERRVSEEAGRSKRRPSHDRKRAGTTARDGSESPSFGLPISRTERKRARREKNHAVVTKLDIKEDLDEVSSSEGEYGSDLDLDKPLYFVGEYAGNRARLVEEMFSSLKKDTIERMIPPILRCYSLRELEDKCVYELDGMSKRRIRAVLNGQDMQSSSGTEDSEEDEARLRQKKQPARDDYPSDDDSIPSSRTTPSPEPSKRRAPMEENKVQTDVCVDGVDPSEMELVELELRAQALRAMMSKLNAGDSPEADEDLNNESSFALEDGEIDEGLDEGHFALEQILDQEWNTRTPSSHPRSTKDGDELPEEQLVDDIQLEDEVPESTSRKEVDKDVFEIHVDEDELADFL